jgi:hypothetical protein
MMAFHSLCFSGSQIAYHAAGDLCHSHHYSLADGSMHLILTVSVLANLGVVMAGGSLHFM